MSPPVNLLIAAAGLNIGGAEVVIQRLTQSLNRERFRVTVCCLKVLGVIGESLAASGHDVVVLSDPGNPRHGYLSFLKLLRTIRLRNIEIVHTHTMDALLDAALCKVLRPSLRLVHTFHFGNYPQRSSQRSRIERIGSLLADQLVAVGDVQRQQLLDAYGFKARALTRIWNGVELPAKRSDNSFRRSIGVSDDHILIGVTATLTEQKGLFDFLTVAGRFRDESNRVHFVIVGEGGLRAQLESERQRLGLENLVTLTGWLPHAGEIAVPAFDVFFQPSLWEAMSIALLEAMAACNAIVATGVGETARIIDDGIDGLLVAPGDIEGMVAGLRRLVDDESLRAALGAAAGRKVAEHFTSERMVRTYESLYLDVLQGRPRMR